MRRLIYLEMKRVITTRSVWVMLAVIGLLWLMLICIKRIIFVW